MKQRKKEKMVKIKYQVGDLFESIDSYKEKIIIAHVCNNKGAWGSGFVIPLGKKYPLAKSEYLENFEWFDLGETQIVEVDYPTVFVANMFAQTLGGKRPLFYNALAKCIDEVREEAEIRNATIIAPMFGAGLAGGNWSFIEELIEDCWLRNNIPVTIFKLK